MFTFEKKLIKIIEQRKDFLFFLIITILGITIRVPGRNFVSKDMYVFLKPWFFTLKELGGLKGLSTQVGDYNILYQTIIALLTYFDVTPPCLTKSFHAPLIFC